MPSKMIWPVGRELDKLIAEKVFGAKVEHLNQQYGWRIDYRADLEECNDPIMTDWGTDGYRLKRYSTDISAAWAIVEELQERDYGFVLDNLKDFLGNWQAIFEINRGNGDAESESVTHAICLAALKAVG